KHNAQPTAKADRAGFVVRDDGTVEHVVNDTPIDLIHVDGIPPPDVSVLSQGTHSIVQRRIEIDLADPRGYADRPMAEQKEDSNRSDQSNNGSDKGDKTKDAEKTDPADSYVAAAASPVLRATMHQILLDRGARWLRLSAVALSRHRSLLM